ncbi:MAG: tetratricopeptide repeat protein [Fimbriimonadaceae bacterium]|nr:tetratricopeptide repeat protein [Fimbriimonadaceae bacterium]
MRLTWKVLLAAVGVTSAVGVIWTLTSAPKGDAKSAERVAAEDRQSAETHYAKQDFAQAEKALSEVVARHAASTDPLVQDQVGVTRLRLGYAAARQGAWDRAREHFQTAEASYKGTDFKTPDFGGVEDQAAYQAAVCLAADGKKEEALKEFEAFLTKHRDSPLVKAAHRRLVMLDEKNRARYDTLLQKVLDEQAAKARFERATCGPKALAYLLQNLGKGTITYEVLAKDCGTTDDGTSLAGMQAGLKRHGIAAFGYEVNRKDFANLPLPALWLQGEHYLVVERIDESAATVYDPLTAKTRSEPLPKSGDTRFLATVLSLSPLSLSEATK